MEKLTVFDILDRRIKLLHMALECNHDTIAYEEIKEALNVVNSVLEELYIRYNSKENSFKNEETIATLQLLDFILHQK